MEKAKIIKVGTIDERGLPHGWVFDSHGIVAGVYVPNPTGFDWSKLDAMIVFDGDEMSLDVMNISKGFVLYGGYTVEELKEIIAREK